MIADLQDRLALHASDAPVALGAGASQSWIWRFSKWGNAVVTGAGSDKQDVVSFYTVHEDGSVSFPMRTADRRAWTIVVPVEAIAAMCDRSPITRSDIERMMIRSVVALEFAALRLISRGDIDGDHVTLTLASLGF